MSNEVVVCRESIARHSKSFALASRLLPPGVGDDAAVVYAWCRRADDAIDLARVGDEGPALVRLRRELDSIYEGSAQSEPTLAAFQDVVRRSNMPREYPAALLDGMEMDVVGTRYQTVEQLLVYCYRVAGVVGLMMCHVMGVRDARALRHAAHLGIGMQLTNICRDVEEDFGRGRLYVPAELLEPSADVLMNPGAPDALRASRDALAAAVRQLLGMADVFYRSGDAGLPLLSWRAALSVRTARLVYSAIGWRIRLRGCDVLSGRAVVPTSFKLVLVLLAMLRATFSLPAALTRRFRPAPLRLTLRYPEDVLPV
jgi:phytoene synthase